MKTPHQSFLNSLFFIIFFLVQLLQCEGRDVETYGWKHFSGACTAESYIPGGKAEIQTTTAPTATLQKTAFQAFFTHVRTGNAAGVAGISSTVSGMLGDVGETFGKAASKLAPALGIIGGIMSTIIGDQTPTAEEILEATNKALATMTEELDHRIDEMKHYVDLEIIKLLKDINHRKYKFLYAYWSGCIKGPESESDLCQREANRLIQSSINEFAMYSDQMNKQGVFDPALTEVQKKKLEVNLVLFRNYVFLSLMATKAVAATYDGKEPSLYKMFNDRLRENANFYKKYADSAIREITELNSEFGITELESSYHNKESDSNSYPMKFKEYKRKCDAVLSPLLPTSHKCNAEVITFFAHTSWEAQGEWHFNGLTWKKWRRDYRKGIRVYYKGNLVNTENKVEQSIADAWCKQVLLEKQDQYKSKIRQEVEKYWEKEVQQVVNCGQKLFATDATTCENSGRAQIETGSGSEDSESGDLENVDSETEN